ncbi:MAG: hypothetical protein N3E37_05055 [Candidatus Micrarchaeota archaeon]|nr:hypothetical protein [Candidatus Micrarchaeota archaeon]
MIKSNDSWNTYDSDKNKQKLEEIINQIPIIRPIPDNFDVEVFICSHNKRLIVKAKFTGYVHDKYEKIILSKQELKTVVRDIKYISSDDWDVAFKYSRDCTRNAKLEQKIRDKILKIIREEGEVLRSKYNGIIIPKVRLICREKDGLIFRFSYIASYDKLGEI